MRFAFAIALASVLAGCADKSIPPEPPTATWTVDSLEFMRILGIYGVDSLMPLGEVAGVARLPDGTFVVADGSASALEYFNAEGEYTRTVGGKGNGPTEFQRLSDLYHCGDSLYVLDIALQKFKVFSSDGVLARSFDVPRAANGSSSVRGTCNSLGSFLHLGSESRDDLPQKSQVLRRNVAYWIAGPTGLNQASLGEHPGLERWFIKGQGSGGGFSMLPLGRASQIALGNTRAYIGSADSFAIDVFALDGSPLGVIRRAEKTRTTSPEDIARYKLLDTIGLPTRLATAHVRDWTDIEFSKTLPAYTAMIVDSAQNLWVRAYPVATGWTVQWFVFGPDGSPLAHVTMPQSFRVAEIGSDWILGVDIDVSTGASVVKSFNVRKEP